jgi:hypothetical protein
MRRAPLVWAALASCQGACPQVPDVDVRAMVDGVAADAPSTDAAVARQASLVPARCHATDRGVLLEGERAPGGERDLDFGDGLAHADEVAVGLVHHTAAGRVAAVAVLRADASSARVIDLGPTLGDAPAPQLAVCRDELVAAAFRVPARATAGGGGLEAGLAVPRPHGGDTGANRDLALYLVDSAEPGRVASSIPQRRDDSLAFDLACSASEGLVVWDETRDAKRDEATAPPSRSALRGVIRAAPFAVDPIVAGQKGVHTDSVRDVSPPESDAEMPRIVPSGHGFFILWIARRVEGADPSEGTSARFAEDASGAIEATGEARTYGWLEMISVDKAGTVTGPLRRLTSTSGHISAYDAQARSDRGKPSVLVVARDDQEVVDGAGGTLWRIRAQDDAVEPAVELPTDGLGRGAPTFVDSPATWVAWVGPREQPRLLPLGASGEVLAGASAEEGLAEARPLLSLPSLSPSPGSGASSSDAAPAAVGSAVSVPDRRMLVATPGDTGAQLRVFGCAYPN